MEYLYFQLRILCLTYHVKKIQIIILIHERKHRYIQTKYLAENFIGKVGFTNVKMKIIYKELIIFLTIDIRTFSSLELPGISTPTISRWSEYTNTSDDNRSHMDTMLYTLTNLPTR